MRNGRTPAGKQRWVCQKGAGERGKFIVCYTTTTPESTEVINQRGDRSPATKSKVFRRKLTGKRFIITSAQNGTPVHASFFEALKTYAAHNAAELIVIPLRYKNPTSRFSLSQQNAEVWAHELQPYLYNARKALNSNVVLFADIKTQPTASSPLTGFEAISAGESCIIGHTKRQMKVIPTPQHKFPKILTTTGACTRPNYTDSKAGKLGEFHHTLGAVIVEVKDSKIFHLRHVSGDKNTGAFYDLDTIYCTGGAVMSAGCAALVMGDTHVDFIDPKVKQATFGKGGMIDVLRPDALVWHDVLDGYAINPHHVGNPFAGIAKRSTGRDDVEAEVRRAVEFVKNATGPEIASYIVASNHDNFLSRWVSDANWKDTPTNAEFYLKTALHMVSNTKLGPSGTGYPNPFGYWVEQMAPGAGLKVLRGDEPLTIAGVELSMHGDHGPSGTRGSIRNLRRIGVRSIIGHSHSPGIDEGCYQVGTSTALRLEYNRGPSSWLNTHCILHADGKRQLINIINGEWRL